MSSIPKHPVLPTDATGEVTQVYPSSEEEYIIGIAAIKNGKATGIDDVLVKQLNNLGPDLLNKFFTENRVPRLWRQSMIKDIPKTIQTDITNMSHV